MKINKVSWLVLFSLLLAFSLYLALKPISNSMQLSKGEHLTSRKIISSQMDNSAPKTSTSQINHESINKKYETIMGSPAEAAEVKKWFTQRGKYFLDDSVDEYLSYSQETLEKLSDTGDMHAMLVLAKLYADPEHINQYGFDAAKNQYWKAAIYGSTEALVNLATMRQSIDYDLSTNEDEKKSIALDVLALYKSAELRGDKWSTENPVKAFKESRKLNLSDADETQIDQKSKKIYDDMQNIRNNIGLGDFDNSVPESVKKFFENIERR